MPRLPREIAKRYLIGVFRRLPESLHALGRDPDIYVLIKHFFGHFFAFCLKKMNFFNLFLASIGYYVILKFLVVNILPSLRSIPQ